MSFYSGLAATAKNLLGKFGQNITVSRYTVGAIDPITGLGSGGTFSSFTGSGAVFDIDTRLVDGDNVLATDNNLYLESTTEILANDKVTANGTDYIAVSVSPLNPGGTVVMYVVQIRS